jgi:hypothetical protein
VKTHIPERSNAILHAWKIIDEVAVPYYDDAQRITRMIGKVKIDLYNLRVRWDKRQIKNEEEYKSEQLEKFKEIEQLRDRSDVLLQEITQFEILKENIANKIKVEAYGDDEWVAYHDLLLPIEEVGYLPPEAAIQI